MAISIIAVGVLIGVMFLILGMTRSAQPRTRRAGGDGGYVSSDGCDAGDGGGGCDGGGGGGD